MRLCINDYDVSVLVVIFPGECLDLRLMWAGDPSPLYRCYSEFKKATRSDFSSAVKSILKRWL
jgi:hypothetical protein